MKRLVLVALTLAVLLTPGGCSLFGEKATVYVTVDTIDATLTTVKFLEPTDNQGSYPNRYDSYVAVSSAASYSWYAYEVRAGAYDVYIEWTGGIESNGRARVFVDPETSLNQWAAVYVDAGGNTWGEEGGGEFSPVLQYYP